MYVELFYKQGRQKLRQLTLQFLKGFSGGSDGKESACNAGDPGLILGLGRTPEEENGNPLQYSCLENSMDRAAWRAAVHGVAKNNTTELSLSLYLKQITSKDLLYSTANSAHYSCIT